MEARVELEMDGNEGERTYPITGMVGGDVSDFA